MSSQPCDNSHNLFLLETAYQIGEYIQSFATQDRKDKSGKPYAILDEMRSGPNPFFDQTTQGLALEEGYGGPSTIHTPFGSLKVLHVAGDSYNEIVEKIKDRLGLVLLYPETYDPRFGSYGPIWAITKWEGKEIEKPAYRNRKEFISYDSVKKVWEKFKTDHNICERS